MKLQVLKRWFLPAILVLTWGLSPAGAAEPTNAAPALPAAAPVATAAAETPTPIHGMLCGADGVLTSPQVAAGEPVQGGGIPDCPPDFSVCEDVPGRNCGLRNCVTEEFKRCRLPGGGFLECPDHAKLQHTTCQCVSVLQLICCEDNSCGFPCGTCSGGSSELVCPN